MFDNIITDAQIDMLLRQQDARNIISKTGHVGRAELPITDEVSAVYQYSVTDDGVMYLHRLEPDRRSFGRITDASEALKNITYDMQNYKRAAETGNIEEYIELADCLHNLRLSIEELFLMYQPDAEALKEIYAKMEELHEDMKKICQE